MVEKKSGRTVLLIDWENLFQSLFKDKKTKINSEFVGESFLKIVEQISQEVGEIVLTCVFTPPYLVPIWEKTFWDKKFFVITCPKISGENNQEQDTVDKILIDMGRKFINNMDLTHLCVATGDGDFVPLYEDAISQGLKTVTIPVSEASLSFELLKVTNKIILFPSI